jgi:glycosyltransferase involved in cell wall biosynthesis
MRAYFSNQNRLLKTLKAKEKFDRVLEFHTVGSTVGMQLAQYWRVGLSVIFDSPVAEQFYEMHGTRSFWWRKIRNSEKLTMEAADKIVVYGAACETYLRRQYAISGRISILPSMIIKSDTVVKESTETFNIGFIGSFLSWHKLDLCVRVFCKFHGRYPDSRLILIGYGQEWNRIKKLVESSGLSEFVVMTGFVSEAELTSLKGKLTVAVMPGSNWYGSPLKLFEYAQAKIPFIAPVSKTVSDIFKDREHCLFIKEGKEEASFFDALEELYTNKQLRSDLAENAYTFVQRTFEDRIYGEKLVGYLTN